MVLHVEQSSASYRIYVLFVLFLTCVSNLVTRNLPTYLVTVPIPACQRICVGIPATTFCELGKEVSPAVEDTQNTHYQACQQCLAAFPREKGFSTHSNNVGATVRTQRIRTEVHRRRDVTSRSTGASRIELSHSNHSITGYTVGLLSRFGEANAAGGRAGLDPSRLQDIGRDDEWQSQKGDALAALPPRLLFKAMPLETWGRASGAAPIHSLDEAGGAPGNHHAPRRAAAGGHAGRTWSRGSRRRGAPFAGVSERVPGPSIGLLDAPASAASPKAASSSTGADEHELYSMAFYNLAEGVCMQPRQYGILAGYGFAIAFAVGSLLAGQTCDRHPRVAVVSIAVVTWSMAMSLQASAHTFTFLMACRCITGLAQAFATPAALSISIDYFGDRQGAAAVLLSAGLYLGSGLASFSVLLAETVGWRWVVLLSGLTGIIVALLLYFTVQEPDRTEWCAPCSLSVVTHEVFDKSRVARLLLLAATCKMFAAYTLGAFLPLWFVRSGLHGHTIGTYAAWNMLVIAGAGLVSTLVAGVVGSIRDPRASCWVGAAGSCVSLPLMLGVILSGSLCASMLCLFLLLIVNDSWLVPAVSLLRASVRRSVRSQAESVFMVASTLAASFGPAVMGVLDTGDDNLGSQLSCIVVLANVAAIVAFVCTANEVSVDPVMTNAGIKCDPVTASCTLRRQELVLFPPTRTTPWFF